MKNPKLKDRFMSYVEYDQTVPLPQLLDALEDPYFRYDTMKAIQDGIIARDKWWEEEGKVKGKAFQ